MSTDEAWDFLVPEPADEYLKRRAEQPDGDQRWIIPGLLHRKLTVIYGLATGGKSTWAYNLADAYLAGDSTFMGQPVHVPGGPKRVAFITTDDDGKDDAADAMAAFGREGQVGVHELPLADRGRSVEDWELAGLALTESGHGLVIVDNASGLLDDDESTNADNDVRRVISRMRVLGRSGLSVVLLTHSNNDGTFGGAAEWRKVARCIYGIYGRVPSATRTVKTMNNKDNLPHFDIRLDGDGPKVVQGPSVRPAAVPGNGSAQSRRQRRDEHSDRLRFMKSREDWESASQIAEALGVNRSTVTRTLGKVGHELRDGAVVPVRRAA